MVGPVAHANSALASVSRRIKPLPATVTAGAELAAQQGAGELICDVAPSQPARIQALDQWGWQTDPEVPGEPGHLVLCPLGSDPLPSHRAGARPPDFACPFADGSDAPKHPPRFSWHASLFGRFTPVRRVRAEPFAGTGRETGRGRHLNVPARRRGDATDATTAFMTLRSVKQAEIRTGRKRP